MQSKTLVLLAFLVWGGISWRWYVCGIKQQCGPNAALANTATSTTDATPGIEPDSSLNTSQLSLQEGATDSNAANNSSALKNSSDTGQSVKEGTQPDLNNSIETTQVVARNGQVTIHFPYNSVRREDDAAVDTYLNNLAARLRASDGQVTLVGHTDAIGDAASNKRMALQRTHHIRKLLLDKGVSKSKIKCVSKGERQPLTSNDTPRGRYKNRRVVVLAK
jgi:outer membrane protein OmpA-like peptidoglycan-associated protein